jgi:hypothetical protein
MSADLAFALVGLVNLIGGVSGIAVAARQLNEKKVMHETLSELEETSSLVVRREEGER